ncbi:hypothetical protein BX666DRAFT_1866434 [Dichotomocladium elegans]|nr:hypothetical protein BX666DRAFT_1866434 [Dichotomocladium elegans]
MMANIAEVRTALDYFFDSRISDAEAIITPKHKTSMYHSLGYGFILFLKCVMTFEQADIEKTLEALKHTIHLANTQRKKDGGWLDNITTWVKGTQLQHLKSMTRVHRHAELVYAEAYLLKALLSIVYDESIVSFLREGLNIRNSYNTYRVLEKYVDFVQAEAAAGKDTTCYQLDDHFTSGVAMGVGCFNIILSLLPATVIKVAEFVGFSSDREHGMRVLESIGDWADYRHNNKKPLADPSQMKYEGLRRQLCDMVLITYHIILSKMIPLPNVDPVLADKILNYNLELYPSGVFFLYFSGRSLASNSHLNEAKAQYERAIEIQQDWKQLQHICYWELGIISIVQKDWQRSYDIYEKLLNESNWSKAVYAYLKGLALYMMAEQRKGDERDLLIKQAHGVMESVTGAKQKIAGKSIPMEKFISRKSRKFIAQGDYLVVPDLEILNAFTAYDFMPVDILIANYDLINKQLASLDKNQKFYHDDLALVHYLRAQLARHRLARQQQPDSDDKKLLMEIHHASVATVLEIAGKINLDHYIYYFTLYEKARMAIEEKDYESAQKDIQTILRANEKGLYSVGAGPHAKNKYSLESQLVFKCHNCEEKIQALKNSASLSSIKKEDEID